MKTTVIKNANQIVTFLGNQAKKGQSMNDISVFKESIIVIEDDIIVYVGTQAQCPIELSQATIIDATNKIVLPGLVDSHTHLVFGEDRANEFYQRLNNVSYQEILQAGGGIHQSIEKTTNTPKDVLIKQAKKTVKKMIEQGVTTIEAKSGYSKDFDGEVKQMQVIAELNKEFDNMLLSTCLAAHVIPKQHKDNPQVYIDMIKHKLIPYVKEHNLAQFFDAFLEENAYDQDQVIEILSSAKEAGFDCKLHCDEIHDLDGATLAANLGCISAEHLLVTNEKGIQAMADHDVIATLLPLTALSLKKPYANARKMIESGCALALATDFNPGSCYSYSMPLLMSLAVLQMDMSIEEMICAITLNGAAALNQAKVIGTIEVNKKADLVIFDCPSYTHLVYHMGINQAHTILKNGNIIHTQAKETI